MLLLHKLQLLVLVMFSILKLWQSVIIRASTCSPILKNIEFIKNLEVGSMPYRVNYNSSFDLNFHVLVHGYKPQEQYYFK